MNCDDEQSLIENVLEKLQTLCKFFLSVIFSEYYSQVYVLFSWMRYMISSFPNAVIRKVRRGCAMAVQDLQCFVSARLSLEKAYEASTRAFSLCGSNSPYFWIYA